MFCVYDVACAVGEHYHRLLKTTWNEWHTDRLWLALPWQTARIILDYHIPLQYYAPHVMAMFVYDHLMPQHEGPLHFRPCLRSVVALSHSLLHLSTLQRLPFIMRRLLRGVRYLPAEERWRQRAVAVLLALHPRTGKDSPMRVLLPDVVRKIMQLEYSTPEITEIGAGPGGGSPTPDVRAF